MSIGQLLDGTANAGSINLSDPNWGILSQLVVGQWGSSAGNNLTARAVGNIYVVGAAGSTVTGAPALLGSLSDSHLTLYNSSSIIAQAIGEHGRH